MIVRIYREVLEYARKTIYENFNTQRRYKNSLSEAEKVEKIFLLVYNQCKECNDGYNSAEIHRDMFLKITKRTNLTVELLKKMEKVGLIKVQANNGVYDNIHQSKKYRIGLEYWRLMKDCKRKLSFYDDVNVEEFESIQKDVIHFDQKRYTESYVSICGGNYSNIFVSRESETTKNTIENVISGACRDTNNCSTHENAIPESSKNSSICITRDSICITRDDLEIYKYFELNHNLLWKSDLSFKEKVNLEKQILNHVPAEQITSGKSFRLKHWIHFLKKEYRKYLLLFDSPIEEVWDKSCCYPSMIAILCKDKVSKTELNEYTKLVQLGDIYTEALKHSKLEATKELRDEIKPYFQTFIQGGKKNSLKLYNTSKEYWNPVQKRKMKPELMRAVMNFYKDKFNEIYNIILNWEVRSSDGKKTISTECSRLEKEIIQDGICKLIPCKFFTIHDAIFIRTEDKEKIKNINFDLQFWKLAGFDTLNLI